MSDESTRVAAFAILLTFPLAFVLGMLVVFLSDHNPVGIFG